MFDHQSDQSDQSEEIHYMTSSFCGQGNCVQVGVSARVLIKDSKNPDVPPQEYSLREWKAFQAGVRNGEFDVKVTLGN